MVDTIFPRRIYMKIGFSSQRREMLLFLTRAKKIIFTAWHSGKLKLAFTCPEVIATNYKSFLTSRIDLTVLQLFEFLKKNHLPVGQVKLEFTSPIAKSTACFCAKARPRQTNMRKLRVSCRRKGKFETLKGFGGLEPYLQA